VGVDDYMDKEAGILAAATAAAVSPKARDLFRRGAVYGLAGVLRTGDMAVAAARGAVRGVKSEAASANGGASRRTPARQTTAAASRAKSAQTKSAQTKTKSARTSQRSGRSGSGSPSRAASGRSS
jgi:hypothetical protein